MESDITGGRFGYEWDDGMVLSAIGDEARCVALEREPHVLLRPIFINAVEVGYAYKQNDREHRLNVRGVTIALFHFISRGHVVLALLPHCFKAYSEKSTNHNELMALYKMNLVEFTQGFGSEKYVEVNRIMVKRAAEIGGCIVARSQMHNIIEEMPEMNNTVETRLLMPAFNGEDLIFPVDGPLGRYGPSLKATLECPPSDPDWGSASHHQLSILDQSIWMRKLCILVGRNSTWEALVATMENFRPTTVLPAIQLPPRPRHSPLPHVHPPETNPPDNHGYSHLRHTLRMEGHPLYSGTAYGALQGIGARKEATSYEIKSDCAVPFLPDYLRTGAERHCEEPRFAELAPEQPSYLGDAPNSIYRIRKENTAIIPKKNVWKEAVSFRRRAPETQPDDQMISKLAVIFDEQLAKRVCSKYKHIKNLALLVEYALEESNKENEEQPDRDLIDLFSDVPISMPSMSYRPPQLSLLD